MKINICMKSMKEKQPSSPNCPPQDFYKATKCNNILNNVSHLCQTILIKRNQTTDNCQINIFASIGFLW